MGLIDKIKSDVKKAGTNKGKFLFIRDGQKVRLRFLQDMDEGFEVEFHDSYAKSINVPCQELFDRRCDLCGDEELRTRSLYCWSVYNYESKEVQLFLFAVNNCSPIPALVALNDNYGTICDRDYIVSVSGKGTSKTYSVIPMDKEKFRNKKAKSYSKSAFLKMLDKAWPYDSDDADEDENYTGKKSKKNKSKEKAKNKRRDEDDDDIPFDDDDEDEMENDYDEMSEKELYKLCIKRDIDVPKGKKAKYYIKQLEEMDEAEDDWDDDEEDDSDDDDD